MRKTQDQQSNNKQALQHKVMMTRHNVKLHAHSIEENNAKIMQTKNRKIIHKFHAQGALSSLSLLLHFHAKYKNLLKITIKFSVLTYHASTNALTHKSKWQALDKKKQHLKIRKNNIPCTRDKNMHTALIAWLGKRS
jgi:hypothetical protein